MHIGKIYQKTMKEVVFKTILNVFLKMLRCIWVLVKNSLLDYLFIDSTFSSTLFLDESECDEGNKSWS